MAKAPKPVPRSQQLEKQPVPHKPALLFDLDGTLLDSVYEHVAAWREALDARRIHVSSVRIHRSVGMSGKLMLRGIFAEMGITVRPQKLEALEKIHIKNFEKKVPSIHVLPSGCRSRRLFLVPPGHILKEVCRSEHTFPWLIDW